VVLAGEESPAAFRVVGVDLVRRAVRPSRVVRMPGMGHEAVETGSSSPGVQRSRGPASPAVFIPSASAAG
jgi:hypothetical protein